MILAHGDIFDPLVFAAKKIESVAFCRIFLAETKSQYCETTFDALDADATLLIRHRQLAYIGAANRFRYQVGAAELGEDADDVFLGLPNVGINDLDWRLKQQGEQPLERTKDTWVRSAAGPCS